MAFEVVVDKGRAYSLGGLALLISVGSIVTALAFEHIGGMVPCPLCLMQRYAFYAGIPALFVALALVSGGKERVAALVFALVALAFLANAALAGYHAGAEWKFWPGPASCGTDQGLSAGKSLLKDLETVTVVRCDEAQGRLMGLSFAGWNVIASLIVFSLSIAAASASNERR